MCAALAIRLDGDLVRSARLAFGGMAATVKRATGAEAALIVNNCAAATLLTLQTLAAGRQVIISRGQLIEIGDQISVYWLVQGKQSRLMGQ